MAGAFALKEVLEARHGHMKRVDDVKAQACRCFNDVAVVLH